MWLYDGVDIVFVNEALIELTGYSADELMEPGAFEALIRPEHTEMIVDRGRRRVRGEQVPDHYEIAIRCADGSERWLDIHARRLVVQGSVVSVVSAFDVTSRKAAEGSLQFLADLSSTLSETLDYEKTLASVARLVVPYVADYCVIDIVNDDGRLQRIAYAHRDPEKQAVMDSSQPDSARFPAEHPISEVIRTAKPRQIQGGVADALAIDDEHRRVFGVLQPHSYLIYPLVHGNTVLGSIGFAGTTRPEDWITPEVMQLAEEVSRRSAQAIEQSRLYKRAHESFEESERSLALLDAIFENSPVAKVFLDTELRVIRANPAAAALTAGRETWVPGVAGAELFGGRWDDMGPCFKQVLKTGEHVLGEESRAPAGEGQSDRVFLCGYYPVRTSRGELLGVGAVALDVTDRKEAEATLQRSEQRLRLAQTAARMGTWEWDMASNEVIWSEELEEVYGFARGTFPGTFEAFLQGVHPGDRDAVTRSIDELVRVGHNDFEHRIVRRDGAVRWLTARGRLFYADDGTPTRAVGVGIDVTQRKVVDEELRRAYAAKDELLGLVSHELRTPLTQILGFAESLLRYERTLAEADRRVALRDIHEQAQRLQRLVENMLVLARMEGGREVEPEPVLLQRMVPGMVEAHRQRHPHRKVELSADPHLPPVTAVPTYFEQMLQNLLSNAEKYSPIDAAVDVTVGTDGESVAVRVLDRGIGIAETEMEAVFEAFFRSEDAAANISGIGLGLAVCKRLAEAQGGRIWAARRPGGGTEMGFTLPLARLPDDE